MEDDAGDHQRRGDGSHVRFFRKLRSFSEDFDVGGGGGGGGGGVVVPTLEGVVNHVARGAKRTLAMK